MSIKFIEIDKQRSSIYFKEIYLEDIDFDEVYIPVVKHASIRVFACYGCFNWFGTWAIWCQDCFLHGELEETIYTDQPEDLLLNVKKIVFAGQASQCAWSSLQVNGISDSVVSWLRRLSEYIRTKHDLVKLLSGMKIVGY